MMTSFKYDDVIMYDSISLTAKVYYKGVTLPLGIAHGQ